MLHIWHNIIHLAAAAPVPKITVGHGEIGVPNSTPTLTAGLRNVTAILMSVIGMLAVVFIIVGALQMVASVGDPKRFQRGRETLLYAIVGLVVAIAAFAIVMFVTTYVK